MTRITGRTTAPAAAPRRSGVWSFRHTTALPARNWAPSMTAIWPESAVVAAAGRGEEETLCQVRTSRARPSQRTSLHNCREVRPHNCSAYRRGGGDTASVTACSGRVAWRSSTGGRALTEECRARVARQRVRPCHARQRAQDGARSSQLAEEDESVRD